MYLGAVLKGPPHRLLLEPLQHAPGLLQRPPAQTPFHRSQWCPRTPQDMTPPGQDTPQPCPNPQPSQHWEAASIRPECPSPEADPPSNPVDNGSCLPPHLPPPGLPVVLLQPEDHWVQVPPRSPRATASGAKLPAKPRQPHSWEKKNSCLTLSVGLGS